MDKPLAIIGEEDIVLGFRALGFKTYAVKEPQELTAALDEIMQQEAAVCLVQDEVYRAAEDLISNYKNFPQPVFIPFSKHGGTDLLDNLVRDIRIRATGAL